MSVAGKSVKSMERNQIVLINYITFNKNPAIHRFLRISATTIGRMANRRN